jgi:diguanylate cyclase (GGDEF)-like protein
MQSFHAARSEGPSRGIFSPEETERLMRTEFERAQRHRYPIVCMLMAVDRLSQLQDLYGRESEREILRAVTGVLRASTRDSDLIAPLADGRLLALFPHTPPDVAAIVARRVLAGARKLRFERDGRTLGVSLSVGVAHNQHAGSLSFDTLVGVAEEGLAVADAAGGDRFVETELYQLYERRRKMDQEQKQRALLFGEPPAERHAPVAPRREPEKPLPAPALTPQLTPQLTKEERLQALLAEEGFAGIDLQGLDLDSIVAAVQGLREAETAGGGEDLKVARDRIDLLERRLAKLTHLLGVTEDELQRVAAMKGIDLGIASIYRSVQGLSDDAANREKKIEMMKEIFKANLEMRQKFTPEPGKPGDERRGLAS